MYYHIEKSKQVYKINENTAESDHKVALGACFSNQTVILVKIYLQSL